VAAKKYRWPDGKMHSRPYAGGHGVGNKPPTRVVGAAGTGRPNLGGAARPPQAGPPPAQSPPGQPEQGSTPFVPDAAYLAAAAQRNFERGEAIKNLTSQGSTDKADTAEAIRRLLSKAPEQRQGIKQSANKAGLFYSGQLGKQLNNYEADLTQNQGDINLDYQRREEARAAARSAIERGAPLEEAAALAEAAGRQVERDTVAAENYMLAPPPEAPAPRAAAAPRPAAPKQTTRKHNGVTQYKWPDGKWHSRPYRGR
jgi:hypothetical protein